MKAVYLGRRLWMTSLVASCSGEDDAPPPQHYDHVIVGFGRAGQAALSQLPTHRRILVIDPHPSPLLPPSQFKQTKVTVARTTVTNLDPDNNLLTLLDGRRARFGNALIATGSYSTPHVTETSQGLFLREWAEDPSLRGVYDLTNPESIAILTKMVEAGRHVTILGGRWEPTSVAVQLAKAARAKGYTRCVTLVCPQAGPLYHSLPRYLSVALAKRLGSAACGVEVLPYALVQFVGGPAVTNSMKMAMVPDLPLTAEAAINSLLDADTANPTSPRAAVFLSHAYDSLETSSFPTDAVAGMPSLLLPPLGADSLPSANVSTASAGNSGYQQMLHFAEAAGLERNEYGGIAANASLSPCRDIYVAGDVASLAMGVMGRGVYSGTEHADRSGAAAGRLMAMAKSGGAALEPAYRHVPVYECRGASVVGVHVAMIGACSAAAESHGYWWKVEQGRAAARSSSSSGKSSRSSGSGSGSGSSVSAEEGTNGSGFNARQSVMEYLTSYFGFDGNNQIVRRREETSREKRPKGKSGARLLPAVSTGQSEKVGAAPVVLAPPLGLGVVFYVDGVSVVGICVSGLPPGPRAEVVYEQCRLLLGTSLANLSSDNASERDLGWSQESERLMRLGALSALSRGLIAPAIGVADSTVLPRPVYRYSARNAQAHRAEQLSRGTVRPAVWPEYASTAQVAYKDRVSAAYSRELRGGSK